MVEGTRNAQSSGFSQVNECTKRLKGKEFMPAVHEPADVAAYTGFIGVTFWTASTVL